MTIHTSFYDKVPELDKSAYTFVRVSRTAAPEWFPQMVQSHVDLSETLGPSQAMLKECHPAENWEEFKPRYIKEVLGALDKASLLELFANIHRNNGSHPLVLLCYETSEENCHRHLIAGFLGVEITEL